MKNREKAHVLAQKFTDFIYELEGKVGKKPNILYIGIMDWKNLSILATNHYDSNIPNRAEYKIYGIPVQVLVTLDHHLGVGYTL